MDDGNTEPRWRVVAMAVLLGLGLLQMSADVLGFTTLKGLAAATTASPAPKVFSAVRGLETYSTRFFLEWETEAKGVSSVELTPARYSRIAGPYNRRNVYGAALAYGAVLATDPRTKPMLDSVMRFALCGRAPLLRELGIDAEAQRTALRVRIEPRAGTNPLGLPTVFPARCEAGDL